MNRLERLNTADGHVFEVAHASPHGATVKGGVIVLHAIYGLTQHIRDVCERWAAAGYMAIAPAHFDRSKTGLVHPYSKDGAEAGRQCYAATNEANILAEIAACHAALDGSGPRIVSGFCTGGSSAWLAAASMEFDAQVNFYGSHIASRHLAVHPRCPTILHYGDHDHVVPPTDIARIAAAYPAVELHVYPGAGHAFFNPEQETFNPDAADLAWERSMAFLERVLEH